MKLTLLYFASLKAARGLASEELESAPANATPGSLYTELRRKHALPLPPGQVRTAVNAAFCDHDKPLKDGDTVAFMPPMSGG